MAVPDPYSFYDSDRDPGDLAELLDPSGVGISIGGSFVAAGLRFAAPDG